MEGLIHGGAYFRNFTVLIFKQGNNIAVLYMVNIIIWL